MVLRDPGGQREAVRAPAEVDIGKQQVDGLSDREDRLRFLSIRRFDDLIAALAKKVADGKPDQHFVVHDKDNGRGGVVLRAFPGIR
jgi:hypothetical protein